MSNEIQIVNFSNLMKIENFLTNSQYLLSLQACNTFNSKLCMERRTRTPCLDHQTGVLQNFLPNTLRKECRMPGFREGQIYTYPSMRWRKSKRQYLTRLQNLRPFRNVGAAAAVTNPISVVPIEDKEYGQSQPLVEETSLGAADISDHSKDSQNHKEEIPKDWYYDEIDMDNLDDLEQGDSDCDYNINGYRRKRKRDRKPAPTRKSRSATAAERELVPQFAMGSGGESSGTPRKGRPPGSANGSGTRRPSRRAASRKSSAAPASTSNSRKFQDDVAVGGSTEPPSFESALANIATPDDAAFSNDLRNYRKYI